MSNWTIAILTVIGAGLGYILALDNPDVEHGQIVFPIVFGFLTCLSLLLLTHPDDYKNTMG